MADLTEEQRKSYWRYNIKLTIILLIIWFVVTYLISGLWAGWLNQFSFLGFPLGYYMAAQGSLAIFVIEIAVYAKLMNAKDQELGIREEPLLSLAMELERIALEDEYFIEKKLYPNVDFYSGITLKAMGLPTSMFTALFAVARTVGWVAHWQEMMAEPTRKIARPRQLYRGEPHRAFVPLEQRRHE